MSPLSASLLHSLWQAGIVWGGLFVGLRRVPAQAADLRYRMALGAICVVIVAWFGTWAFLSSDAERISQRSAWVADTSFHGTSAPATDNSGPAPIIAARNFFSDFSWQGCLLFGWRIGVLLGFWRIANSVAASRRLFRETMPIKNERWLRQLDEICEAFGTRVAVKLRTSRRILAPVVVGVLWPAIVLPASLLTGVPRDMLRAALAHEAAHIARWDPLINLLQMGVEALLFFNPFVWLINQTARQEREACCDAMASHWCGDPAAYSEALVWWTRHSYGVTVGATAAMKGNGNRLFDRVARLLHPARIPHVLSGWPAGAGWAFLVGLFFLSTAYGVRFTVLQLSASERLARISQITEPFRRDIEPVAPPTAPKRSFSGVIVDESGAPVAGARWTIFSEMPRRYPGATREDGKTGADGKFAGTIPEGLLRLRVRSENFATRWETYPPAQSSENVRVVVSPGIEFAVLCVDPEGAPIAGAKVGIEYEDSDGDGSSAATGADGVARIQHQYEGKVGSLYFSAPGYQDSKAAGILVSAKDKVPQFALKKAVPYVLTIIDEVDGTPLKDVSVRVKEISPQLPTGTVWPQWNYSPRTDAHGMVRLDGLNPACSYGMMAEAQGRGTLFRISPGENNASTVRFARERRVRLKIINLDDVEESQIRIQVSQWVTSHEQDGGSVTVSIVDGAVEAELGGRRRGAVSFHFLGQWVKGPDLKDEVTDFTIDYAKIRPPPKQKVVLICDVGRKGAAPVGEFFLNWAMSEDASVSGGLSAPIVDGRAEFELPAGALFQLRNGSLHGGTIDESKRYQVTGNPTVITVKVKPAGLIRVKVLEKDGRLATGMYVGGRSVSDPNKHLEIKDMVSGSEAPREWYPSQSIELGSEKYVIRALAGNRVVLSAPVRVDEDAPIKDVVLTLPEPTTREVLVVDERGAPVPDVGLQALLEFNGEKFYGASTQSDSSGVARVILGNGGAKVKMSLRVLATNLVPTFQPVDFSKAAQIRLVVPTGHRVTGRVVDRESGAGVPEVEICWAVDQMYAPSLKTDAAGRFEFLNCPPGRVFLSTRLTNGRNFDKDQSFYATSDGAEFVIYTREGPPQ